MRKILSIICILFASLAHAQLDVRYGSAYLLPADTTIGKTDGGQILLQSADVLIGRNGAAVVAETKAANIDFEVEDQSRNPVEFDRLSLKSIFLTKPGKFWVEVTAIDFEQNIYGKKTVVVEVGQGPNPPPPGPDPPGPTPDVVPNKYGIGSVVFANAPRDPVTLDKYARIYKQAGDFLFGIPSLKFILSSNDSHANDPNRSVMAWIAQQTANVQCTDQQVCSQWVTWRSTVAQAIRESQQKRQFTRQDWYAAFGEISQALQAVK